MHTPGDFFADLFGDKQGYCKGNKYEPDSQRERSGSEDGVAYWVIHDEKLKRQFKSYACKDEFVRKDADAEKGLPE